MSPPSFKRLARQILSKHLNLTLYHAFIFGSRATGSGDRRSDYDIGIEGPSSLDISTLARIKEDFEESSDILHKVDVVDFKSVSPNFYQVAKSQIEPL